jgi:hypothetical protein
MLKHKIRVYLCGFKAKDCEGLLLLLKLLFLAIGNNEANEGNYGTAIEYFTQAISLHNRDFRLVEESKVF